MLYKCKAEISIKKVDNGFVVEWEEEKPQPRRHQVREIGWDDDIQRSGIEVIASKDALLKRLKELL